jgi:hypothetical protein
MTLNITILSIVALNIVALSIMILNINTRQNDTLLIIRMSVTIKPIILSVI